MRKLYLISSVAMLLSYGASSVMGWGIAETRREKIPADARQSPGGYRSYHFWHSGFHGGK